VEAQFTRHQNVEPAAQPNVPLDPVLFGAAILQAAIDFDERRHRDLPHAAALADMLQADHYHPDVISAIAQIEAVELAERTKMVPVGNLEPGMILEQDICVRSGMCLIGSGQQITPTSLQRLEGFSNAMEPDLMVCVRVPEA
jgi:hypothetical protein